MFIIICGPFMSLTKTAHDSLNGTKLKILILFPRNETVFVQELTSSAVGRTSTNRALSQSSLLSWWPLLFSWRRLWAREALGFSLCIRWTCRCWSDWDTRWSFLSLGVREPIYLTYLRSQNIHCWLTHTNWNNWRDKYSQRSKKRYT